MRWMPAESSTVGSWAKAVAAAMAPIQTPIFRPSRLIIRGNKKGRAGGPALVSPKRKLLLFVLLRGLLRSLLAALLVALLRLFLLVHLLATGMGYRHSLTVRTGEHSCHQVG